MRFYLRVAVFFSALILSFTYSFSFAEETAAPARKPRVDAMYDKEATSGLNIRYPEDVSLSPEEKLYIKNNGSIEKSIILETAFRFLESGNPFLLRYNVINDTDIQPFLSYGIPYFFGGRKMKNVLSKAPEYRTWIEWQDSVYYRKDMRYFLGLDCRGFLYYVWQETGIKEYGISQNKFKDSPQKVFMSGTINDKVNWSGWKDTLRIGDVLAIYHPSQHILFYIGTLSDYGYTEADFPADPSILDYPLAIHCGVNAIYADWFYKIKQSDPKKYKKTSVPDGGVSVSILGYNNKSLVKSVYQQKQTTYWVDLPDGSWLTVIPWNDVSSWFWYR